MTDDGPYQNMVMLVDT